MSAGKASALPGLPAARLWAATNFPYLATGLFAVQVIPASGVGTVAIDGGWRLYADPDVTATWTSTQLGSVLVHHVCHLLREHGERAVTAKAAQEDMRSWIRAADAEINDDLIPVGLELPGRPIMPRHLGAPPGLLAEQYYQRIRAGTGGQAASGTSAAGQDQVTDDDGWDIDCGSGADGRQRTWDSQTPAAMSSLQAELLRRLIAQECIRHAREAGTVAAGMLRWARNVLDPVVDWRKVLAAELRRAVADVAGAVDYSYRRPSRRATVSPDVVLPALRRPVPQVAVVLDTSGSMSGDLLEMALAEVEGLLRSLGLARQVRVLACDSAASTARRVTKASQVELVGGGGTDMGAGIAAAAALRPRPAVTIVLTDGFTPWPAAAPRGTRVVIGLLGSQAPPGPAWARSVRVPREFA